MRDKLIELINTQTIDIQLLWEHFNKVSTRKMDARSFERAIKVYASHVGVFEVYRWSLIEYGINILILKDGSFYVL